METTELTKNTRVRVVRGLWRGFEGIIEDIHDEASVIRLKADDGDTAYALKDDVEAVEGPKTD